MKKKMKKKMKKFNFNNKYKTEKWIYKRDNYEEKGNIIYRNNKPFKRTDILYKNFLQKKLLMEYFYKVKVFPYRIFYKRDSIFIFNVRRYLKQYLHVTCSRKEIEEIRDFDFENNWSNFFFNKVFLYLLVSVNKQPKTRTETYRIWKFKTKKKAILLRAKKNTVFFFNKLKLNYTEKLKSLNFKRKIELKKKLNLYKNNNFFRSLKYYNLINLYFFWLFFNFNNYYIANIKILFTIWFKYFKLFTSLDNLKYSLFFFNLKRELTNLNPLDYNFNKLFWTHGYDHVFNKYKISINKNCNILVSYWRFNKKLKSAKRNRRGNKRNHILLVLQKGRLHKHK